MYAQLLPLALPAPPGMGGAGLSGQGMGGYGPPQPQSMGGMGMPAMPPFGMPPMSY